jgi:hypothetical protein
MRKKRRSIRELVQAAGGTGPVSAAVGVTRDAVLKWEGIGIPDRHWPILLPLCNSTADEMLAANITARTGNLEQTA